MAVNKENKESKEPLASQIRPKNLDEFVGQEPLVGEKGPLRVAIKEKHLFSFILWGPPGVGKTTLARIYAKALNADYHELSAVSAGKDDIRKIIEEKNNLFGPRILFLDEIHRFNKAQQDFLLPAVEKGLLTLIGATTENPSFEVIPALLSRCRVFVMEELSDDDMEKIIKRTEYKISADARDWVVSMAGGDARQAIAIIENTGKLYGTVTKENLTQTLQAKFLRYDKKGDEHYNTISAFIKSMRASQPDAALYYLARMIQAGEDPKFIARRMVIFASEDIGMEDPNALSLANAVFRAVETIGYPEAGINLSHGVVYLSKAPKSKASYYAYLSAMEDAQKYGNLPVPMSIRNAPTKLMKDLGYHKGYEKYTKEDLLPEKIKGKKYWQKDNTDEI
ncbi:MAG TPA: replication-associated recombination protein A [Candidatus Paceibacterota bacterium]|jgi:putative ATPase|nr:replication-associated recombination protein A [Candidatus Paceibacterota bacterium]